MFGMDSIRSAVAIVLVGVGLVVAMGSVASSADATKNTGRYKTSSEAKRQERQQRRCDDLSRSFQNFKLIYEAAWEAGDTEIMKQADADMTRLYKTMQSAGCFAGRVKRPRKPFGMDRPT